MTPETVRALCAINERFYRTHSDAFASKRTRFWPGMQQVLDALPAPPGSVLDVGCGHGRFAAMLQDRGYSSRFVGVDGSPTLLDLARERDDLLPDCRFECVDVIEAPESIPRGPFDLVTLFAVVHHIPSAERRAALIRSLAKRVSPGGTLAVSFWRWREDLGKRDVPWSVAGIDEAAVEPGDRLQRFDSDDDKLRYAHFADEDELDAFAGILDATPPRRFDADGQDEAGNAYFVWRLPPA